MCRPDKFQNNMLVLHEFLEFDFVNFNIKI